MKKVYFLQRLLAYIVDYLIITLILFACISIFEIFVPTSPKVEKATNDFLESYNNLLLDPENAKLDEFYDNIYIIEKDGVPTLLFGIIINLAYFGAFQFYNKGQTFGKKLLKIKIARNSANDKYTYLVSVIRAALTYSSISNLLISLVFICLGSDIYIMPYMFINTIAGTFKIISIFMIVFRKDGRGLPDMICHTRVESVN